MTLRRKAFTAIRWTTFAAVARASLQLAQVAVLARLLAPAEYGLMAIVAVLVALGMSVGDLGITSAFVQRESVTAEQRSSLFWLNLMVSTGIALVLAAAAPLIALVYGNAQLTPLIVIGATTLVVQASTQQLWASAEKQLLLRTVALIEVGAGLCGFVVALLAALAGWGVYALVLSPLTSACVCALMSWPFLAQGWRPLRRCRYSDVRSFLRFGTTTVVSSLVGQVNMALDVLIGGRTLSATALGVYSVPRNLALQLQFIINPIVTRVGFPLIAQVQGDVSRVRVIYLSALNMTSSVNAPLYLGLAFFAPEVTAILLGDGWHAAGQLLRFLALWGGMRSMVNPVGSLLLGVGRADLHLKWNVALLVGSVPTLLLGCQYGAVGLASALLAIAAVSVFASWFFLVRATCRASLTEFCLAVWRPYALAAVAVASAHALADWSASPLPRLLCGIAVSVPIYLFLSRFLNREWAIAMLELACLHKPKLQQPQLSIDENA